MTDQDPMTDYISLWVNTWMKVQTQTGGGISETAVVQMTRDIVGPFVYFIEDNLEYYGLASKGDYMKKAMVDAVKAFSEQQVPTEVPGGGFVPATQLPPTAPPAVPANPQLTQFENPQGMPVYAQSDAKYKVVIDSKNTYDHRAKLRELGLRWNRDDKQWEGDLAIDKIQAVKNFAATTGLEFKTG